MLRRALPSSRLLRGLITLWICATFELISVSGRMSERIVITDNRTAAGTPAGQTLTVHLEARTGEWHPDGDSDPGVVVKAFAVEGGPVQIPGPLIRVTEGTTIRASVRNRLEGDPLVIHGLYSRPGPTAASDVIVIPAGETREVTFTAGRPGTYYYWGATNASTTLSQRPPQDSQLSGAFIVDPADGPPQTDRVLLIGLWGDAQAVRGGLRRIVVNGRSWPHTERLTYQVGDSVRMRVINAGAAVHPMHLHGFYFNVDSRGDEREDTVFPAGSSPHLVVTERLASGRTFTLTWKPTRPGNWLFHCHDNSHLLSECERLDGKPPQPAAASHHVENHALEMMAGPVMGITVDRHETAEPASDACERRRLRLVARVDAGGTAEEPAFGYTLDDGKTTPAAAALLAWPNDRAEAWRAGQHYSGESASGADGRALARHRAGELLRRRGRLCRRGKRIAPAIEPGASFEARFTPPRSGPSSITRTSMKCDSNRRAFQARSSSWIHWRATIRNTTSCCW